MNKLLPEIDNHTTKLIVGIIALSLASLTNLFSAESLDSISASYWDLNQWPRNIFVGCLFAIGAFLLSYNGLSKTQMILSKVAAIAAICVAMFPCKCGIHEEIIPGVHYASAAVMFTILAVFCYFFMRRALSKKTDRARVRAIIYGACGCVIAVSIVLMAMNILSESSFTRRIPRFTFFAEAAALIAFGIAWLTASLKLPVVTTSEERLPLL